MKDEGLHKIEATLWVGLFLLIIVVCLNGAFGYQAASHAMLAFSAQTASGACLLAVVIMRMRTMKVSVSASVVRELNRKVSLGTILLAVTIMVIGAEMGLTSIKSFFHLGEAERSLNTVIVLLLSILTRKLLYHNLEKFGKRFGTQAFISNIRSPRFNIYSSFVALLALMIAVAGEHVGVLALGYADPIAALIIACFIIIKGYNLVRKTLTALADTTLNAEDIADFLEVVQRIHGVITVDDLSAREHGHYVVIEMTISVNPRLSVWEGQEVSKKIKQQLMKQYQHVSDVFIHVNPYDAGYPYKQHADTELTELPSVLH
ncbi:cation diffusion facilitator family transporter [Paenibacillus roseipurpureus]|uniref:Cation diffusion facilitator family transporter n=1 Tax=Paenibacillus roseopurpureus TaxID=2918901 RepID=A0AA96LST1_9BACL|nr:cation diffusion facilitator family transporter [Paenibacillus sp. MBLB1832]WNR45881.1 cation diffusion facilitator family transporter [Paenibacillus sp. MBLB1832]